MVSAAVEEHMGISVRLTIKHMEDFRNYKVSTQKADNVLSFHPDHDVKSIVHNLVSHLEDFEDWDNPMYYNIQVLKGMDRALSPSMVGVVTA